MLLTIIGFSVVFIAGMLVGMGIGSSGNEIKLNEVEEKWRIRCGECPVKLEEIRKRGMKSELPEMFE